MDKWPRRVKQAAYVGLFSGSILILYVMAASESGAAVRNMGYGLFILSSIVVAAAAALEMLGDQLRSPRK